MAHHCVAHKLHTFGRNADFHFQFFHPTRLAGTPRTPVYSSSSVNSSVNILNFAIWTGLLAARTFWTPILQWAGNQSRHALRVTSVTGGCAANEGLGARHLPRSGRWANRRANSLEPNSPTSRGAPVVSYSSRLTLYHPMNSPPPQLMERNFSECKQIPQDPSPPSHRRCAAGTRSS